MRHFKASRACGIVGILTHRAVYLYWIVPLIFLSLYSVVTHGRYTGFYGMEFSNADLLILTFTPLFFAPALVLFWSFLVAVILSGDFSPAVVIRYPSKQALWWAQTQKTLLLSFVYTLYLTVMIAVLGKIVCETPVNFTSANSLFFHNTGVVLEKNISLAFMLLVFFISAFLPIVAMCLIMALSKWVWGNNIFGALIIVAIAVADMMSTPNVYRGLIYVYCLPYYPRWLHIPGIFLSLLVPLGWVVGLIILGFIVSKRRDFLYVQQK